MFKSRFGGVWHSGILREAKRTFEDLCLSGLEVSDSWNMSHCFYETGRERLK